MINLAMGVKKRRNCAGRNGGWRKAIRGDLAMRAATRERMISTMASSWPNRKLSRTDGGISTEK